MATSFRLPEEQTRRLNRLAKRLGISKAQVVKLAIDKYYELEIGSSKRTAFDRLAESGFQPISSELGFSSEDETAQREIIRAKLASKRNN